MAKNGLLLPCRITDAGYRLYRQRILLDWPDHKPQEKAGQIGAKHIQGFVPFAVTVQEADGKPMGNMVAVTSSNRSLQLTQAG